MLNIILACHIKCLPAICTQHRKPCYCYSGKYIQCLTTAHFVLFIILGFFLSRCDKLYIRDCSLIWLQKGDFVHITFFIFTNISYIIRYFFIYCIREKKSKKIASMSRPNNYGNIHHPAPSYLPSHYITMTYIIAVHFNNLYCTEICDKLSKDLAMCNSRKCHFWELVVALTVGSFSLIYLLI